MTLPQGGSLQLNKHFTKLPCQSRDSKVTTQQLVPLTIYTQSYGCYWASSCLQTPTEHPAKARLVLLILICPHHQARFGLERGFSFQDAEWQKEYSAS
jgi:hypothetical protein